MSDWTETGTPSSAPDSEEEFSIKGDLETTSVPELLRTFLQAQETGLLVCRNGDTTKIAFLKQGRVIFATSNDPDERLGEDLLVRGRITVRQYVEASKQIGPGRRLGKILVDMKAIEPDELSTSIEHHVKRILLDLCNWVQGEYELFIKNSVDDDAVVLKISTENLILEGIRRCHSWTRVIAGIGGSIESSPSPVSNDDLLYKLDLTEEEQEVLSRVNGKSTIDQICQISYLSHFETCRILWALQVVGAIKAGRPPDTSGVHKTVKMTAQQMDLEEIVELFNDLLEGVYRYLKGQMGDQVDPFMDRVLDELSRQYGALFEGTDLKYHGRADYEQLVTNVAAMPAEERKNLVVTGLNELVFVLQLTVRSERGVEDAAAVSVIIKEGFEKLGAL